MDKPRKRWVSSRLTDKKKDMGIVEPPKSEYLTYDTRKEPNKVYTPRRDYNSDKKESYRRDYNSDKKESYRRDYNSDRRDRNKKKHVIRISNLPIDITVRELAGLVSGWGEIGNINVKQYYDSASSYIDFYNKEEVDYFIKALDSTPFDNLIIKVEVMNFT